MTRCLPIAEVPLAAADERARVGVFLAVDFDAADFLAVGFAAAGLVAVDFDAADLGAADFDAADFGAVDFDALVLVDFSFAVAFAMLPSGMAGWLAVLYSFSDAS